MRRLIPLFIVAVLLAACSGQQESAESRAVGLRMIGLSLLNNNAQPAPYPRQTSCSMVGAFLHCQSY